MIKDLDSSDVWDLNRRNNDLRLEEKIKGDLIKKSEKVLYYVENLKIQEKINTKFFKACERGEFEKINIMLTKKTSKDRKPNINEKYLHDFTVLHIAITNGYEEIIRILVQKGARIDAETTMRRRPIHLAVLKGDFKIVDFLVACGANVNCLDIDKNTPLHFASRLGYKELVKYLLFKEANVTQKNHFQETPIDICCNIDIHTVNNILI